MESLLYSISGLPVHALVVHFAVVILPISASALILLAYIPKLRKQYAFITTLGVVGGSAAALVAKQSGEALAEKIGNPLNHSNYGTYLTVSSFLLLITTLLWYRSSKGRRSNVITSFSHVIALIALIVLGLTFLTGHSGAQAVWKGKLPSSTNTNSSSTPTPTSTSKVAGSYNLADLQKHASAKSCWSAINGNVYDLTKWIARHPGGPNVIKGICGTDGSAGFNGQHSGATKPASYLATFKIGKFVK